MTTSGFIMTEIPSLMTKVKQILELHTVRNSLNKHYALLLEKKFRFWVC